MRKIELNESKVLKIGSYTAYLNPHNCGNCRECYNLTIPDIRMDARIAKRDGKLLYSQSDIMYRRNGLVGIDGFIDFIENHEFPHGYGFIKKDMLALAKKDRNNEEVRKILEKPKEFMRI